MGGRLLLFWCLMMSGLSAQSPMLRVVTWNIHHGAPERGPIDLAAQAAVLRATEPDVVLLQEVDVKTQRSGGVDQAMELAWLLGMQATFGKALDFQGGGYGNALLSKAAPAGVAVHQLPGVGEPRAVLEVTLPVPGFGEVTFFSTHLEVSSAEARLLQAQTVRKIFDGRPGLVIGGGDFNAGPQDEVITEFKAPWLRVPKTGVPFTIPSDRPRREIDFFLYRPGPQAVGLELVRCEVITMTEASDHLPVVLEVRPLSK